MGVEPARRAYAGGGGGGDSGGAYGNCIGTLVIGFVLVLGLYYAAGLARKAIAKFWDFQVVPVVEEVLSDESDSLSTVHGRADRWATHNLPRERELPIPMVLVEQEVGHSLPPNTMQPVALLKSEVVYSTLVDERAWAGLFYGCDRQHYSVESACRRAFPGTGYIVHSPDGGRSWDIQEEVTNWCPIALVFTTETEGYAIGDTGLFYTSDGTKHWTRLDLSSEIREIREVKSIEGSRLAIVCNDDGAIYESFDKGLTWQRER